MIDNIKVAVAIVLSLLLLVAGIMMVHDCSRGDKKACDLLEILADD